MATLATETRPIDARCGLVGGRGEALPTEGHETWIRAARDDLLDREHLGKRARDLAGRLEALRSELAERPEGRRRRDRRREHLLQPSEPVREEGETAEEGRAEEGAPVGRPVEEIRAVAERLEPPRIVAGRAALTKDKELGLGHEAAESRQGRPHRAQGLVECVGGVHDVGRLGPRARLAEDGRERGGSQVARAREEDAWGEPV